MKPKYLFDDFFVKSSIEMQPYCFSYFPEGLTNGKKCVVCGLVTKTKGRQFGIFPGSQILSFVDVDAVLNEELLQVEPHMTIALPTLVSTTNAAASAKYLCQINMLRKSAPPLCSKYALTKSEPVFESLLNALGYICSVTSEADFIIDTDGSMTDYPQIREKYFLRWHQDVKLHETFPGAEWDAWMHGSSQRLTYSNAYIRTTVKENLRLYFSLISTRKLNPDTSDVIVLKKDSVRILPQVEKCLFSFSPYENYIENRIKPMLAVYITGNKSKETEALIAEVNSWIGYTCSICEKNGDNIKLGYPDGSIADILRIEKTDEYIELHFDGATILRLNGVASKF